MRSISKRREPPELVKYRKLPGAKYDGEGFTATKIAIRTQLLREQGHLCAYCMCRIYAPNVKIEHWHSQKKHPLEQLDYGNLLCCCMGSEGSPQKSQHCDTRKRDRDILYNPSNPGHHMKLKIRYDGAGKIRSDSNAFERDINDVLNLNTRQLMRNRIEVIQEVQRKLGPTPGLRKKTEIEKLLRRWRATDSSGRLAPYCDVAIDYLLKHPSVRDSKSK